MKKVAIIQARMSSTRLPGKVLMALGEVPMLLHVAERVSSSKELDDVIVATSSDPADDVIADVCKKNKINYFRGSLSDVLERYFKAAKSVNASIIIRVCADSPLVDGGLIDKGINKLERERLDYVSVDQTFPLGFNFEVFTFRVLETAYKNAKEIPEREHVTPYIWRNHPEEFRIGYLKDAKSESSSYRLTVDTKEDLLVVGQLIEKFAANKKNYLQIIECLNANPGIAAINKNVKQKRYGE